MAERRTFDREEVQRCCVCSCTEDDCTQCVERTGDPCHWVAEDLCSACEPFLGQASRMVTLIRRVIGKHSDFTSRAERLEVQVAFAKSLLAFLDNGDAAAATGSICSPTDALRKHGPFRMAKPKPVGRVMLPLRPGQTWERDPLGSNDKREIVEVRGEALRFRVPGQRPQICTSVKRFKEWLGLGAHLVGERGRKAVSHG